MQLPWLFALASTLCFADCKPKLFPDTLIEPSNHNATGPTLTIVAMGDSVVWGNGLKLEHKSLIKVAHQIADLTQRNVQVVSFAHSGARLNTVTDATDYNFPGDLNAQALTTVQQEQCAATDYHEAELILLDGCINEVGATNIALPPIFTQKTPAQITHDSTEFCGDPMQKLLASVKTDFKRATVVVYAYYPVVSKDSKPLSVDSKSGQAMVQMYPEAIAKSSHDKVMSQSKTVRVQSWQANSDVFNKTSTNCFQWAVAVANGSPGVGSTACMPPVSAPVQKGDRFLLATAPWDPSFSYGASHTRLWRLRGKFLFLTWNKDDFYYERRKLCQQFYKKDDLTAQDGCEINPIAHPNLPGAQSYTDTIVPLIKAAWGM